MSILIFHVDSEQLSQPLSLDILQTKAASSTVSPAAPVPCCSPKGAQAKAVPAAAELGMGSRPGWGLQCPAPAGICQDWEVSLLTDPVGDKSPHKLWSSFSSDPYYNVDNPYTLEYTIMIILAVLSSQPIWKTGVKTR